MSSAAPHSTVSNTPENPENASSATAENRNGVCDEFSQDGISATAVSDGPLSLSTLRQPSEQSMGNAVETRLKSSLGADQFDYEIKYAEDEKFQEMGPMARVWKVFIEEYGKLDADKVEDWRDALDVLLVFAGLFSGVVSTFVSQTSQDLKPDFSQVSANLMTEMVSLQRASMNNLPDSTVPSSPLSADSPAQPTLAETWVNALWFTSLALSLSTALITVLAKQWIHQFLSMPSGTLRDRSRIRQFRSENLEAWHVPLIIGLLPVLMHVALGAFLVGLFIHVKTLSFTVSMAVGCIALLAFVSYFWTNMLPLLDVACPYKTYLTRYSYRMYGRTAQALSTLRHATFVQLASWLHPHLMRRGHSTPDLEASGPDTILPCHPAMSPPVVSPPAVSLDEAEKHMVADAACELEARAVTGLYNVSSNTSVQRIVLQALSILPMQSLALVMASIPDLDDALRRLLSSPEYTLSERQTAYERLYRAHVRVWTVTAPAVAGRNPQAPQCLQPPHCLTPSLTPAIRPSNSLSVLLYRRNPEHATSFLRDEIRGSSRTLLDPVIWAMLLQNATRLGTSWLDIGDNNSAVWMTFVHWLLQTHDCLEQSCNPSRLPVPVVSLPVHTPLHMCGNLDRRAFHLKAQVHPLTDNPTASTEPIALAEAVGLLMLPSVSHYIFSTVFASQFAGDLDYEDVPVDILLHLALIQLPSIQATSRDTRECAKGVRGHTPMTSAILCILQYLGVHDDMSNAPGGILVQHRKVIRASYRSLITVIHGEAFRGDGLTPSDRIDVIRGLFRALSLDQELVKEFSEATGLSIIRDILLTACHIFTVQVETVRLVREIIDTHICAIAQRVATPHVLLDEVYATVCETNWLQDVGQEWTSILEGAKTDPTHLLVLACFSSTYVDGLPLLEHTCRPVYNATLASILVHEKLVTLCKLLVLTSDVRSGRLRAVASLSKSRMGSIFWDDCHQALDDFFNSRSGEELCDQFNINSVDAVGELAI